MDLKTINHKMRTTYHDAGIRGKGITFAVFDTGVNEYGLLKGHLTGDGDDVKGHGTWVAEQLLRYCPEANIVSYKIKWPSDVAEACEDVIERKKGGERIIVNMSMATTAEWIKPYVDAVVAAGVPFVCAAGNDGEERLDQFPSCFESPITVAALDKSGKKAYFSTWHDEVDFSDYGVNVEGIGIDGQTMYASGTSMATPQVAGKIGLLMSANPKMTEPEVYEALKDAAEDLNKQGRDPLTGYGFIALPVPHKKEEEEVIKMRLLKLVPKPRMQGADVRELQGLLNENGAYIEIDGVFGPATDAAVRAYQRANGLTVDGIVGEKTWASLKGDAPEEPDKDREALAEDMTAWLRMMVGDHYIIGGQGHELTREYLDRRYEAAPAYFSDGRYEWLRGEIDRAEALGRKLYCEDCSGLFFAVNAMIGIIPEKDMTADGLWGKCEEINFFEIRPLDILFQEVDGKMEHMAIVGTDGVYEAAGTAYGVQYRSMDKLLDRAVFNRMTGKIDTKRAWTHAGRLR